MTAWRWPKDVMMSVKLSFVVLFVMWCLTAPCLAENPAPAVPASVGTNVPAVLPGDRCLARTPMSLPQSAGDLWQSYVASEADGHPHLPDVSYAGYRYGEEELPRAEALYKAVKFGIVADDGKDDGVALHRAIAAIGESGGGVLELPQGVLEFHGPVIVNRSKVVLRGQGVGRTVLCWRKGDPDRQQPWSGGLLIIGNGSGRHWDEDAGVVERTAANTLKPLEIHGAAGHGSRAVQVWERDTERLAEWVGRPVTLVIDGDREIEEQFAGSNAFVNYPWDAWLTEGRGGRWRHGNEVVAVREGLVVLKKPLRVALVDQWKVTLADASNVPAGIGVEDLTIRTDRPVPAAVPKGGGWNAIAVYDARHCWLRNLRVENSDTALIMDYAEHVTVTGFEMDGGPMRDGISVFIENHDNLIQDCVLKALVGHGLTVWHRSSGNVFRHCRLEHGTMSTGRGLPFDNIRTDIVVCNDGHSRGDKKAGPYQGRRMVLWNVEVTNGEGRYLLAPWRFPMGALVGVRGCERELPIPPGQRELKDDLLMPGGDVGCIEVGTGAVPEIPDLYLAQLRHRLAREAAARQGIERVSTSPAVTP